MKHENEKIAGLLLIIGGVQCFLAITVAEALYPGYSISENWISDLGVGPSAIIFNSSIFLLGVLGVAATYFFQRAIDSRVLPVLYVIASVGAMGVGLFTEDVLVLHAIFSLITFIFAGLSAIASYKMQKTPLSYLSVVLGAFALLAIVLTFSGTYLGIGKGGMERMIAYPVLLWVIYFGGYLIGSSSDVSEASKL